jgi:glycosyltransferase involved in cell wall biosynthesis
MNATPVSARPLRLLQATLQYAPFVGGVATHTREVSSRLQAAGHDVQVLTADPNWDLPPEEIHNGIPVRRVRAWPKGGDQLIAPGITRVVHGGPWDVVHVQGYQTALAPLAMAGAARAGIPYLLTFHGGGHSQSFRNKLRARQLKILRPLLARAHALIATAEWEIARYSELLDLPTSKFVLIPNGGDVAPPARDTAPVDGTLLISIGRLERYKGHHLAIAALPHVLESVPDARLWIAGDGPYEQELRELAARLGVSERVDIYAERDRGVFSARLDQAAAGLLLSEFETHPLAAVEALTMATPMVVGLDGGGCTELVSKGLARGVALDAGSLAHAAAIVDVVRDPPPAPDIAMPTWEQGVAELTTLYRAIASPEP